MSKSILLIGLGKAGSVIPGTAILIMLLINASSFVIFASCISAGVGLLFAISLGWYLGKTKRGKHRRRKMYEFPWWNWAFNILLIVLLWHLVKVAT
ncbi:MAG: hypothetical protein V4665_04605 [Patescibacteria group bacterium]